MYSFKLLNLWTLRKHTHTHPDLVQELFVGGSRLKGHHRQFSWIVSFGWCKATLLLVSFCHWKSTILNRQYGIIYIYCNIVIDRYIYIYMCACCRYIYIYNISILLSSTFIFGVWTCKNPLRWHAWTRPSHHSRLDFGPELRVGDQLGDAFFPGHSGGAGSWKISGARRPGC